MYHKHHSEVNYDYKKHISSKYHLSDVKPNYPPQYEEKPEILSTYENDSPPIYQNDLHHVRQKLTPHFDSSPDAHLSTNEKNIKTNLPNDDVYVYTYKENPYSTRINHNLPDYSSAVRKDSNELLSESSNFHTMIKKSHSDFQNRNQIPQHSEGHNTNFPHNGNNDGSPENLSKGLLKPPSYEDHFEYTYNKPNKKYLNSLEGGNYSPHLSEYCDSRINSGITCVKYSKSSQSTKSPPAYSYKEFGRSPINSTTSYHDNYYTSGNKNFVEPMVNSTLLIDNSTTSTESKFKNNHNKLGLPFIDETNLPSNIVYENTLDSPDYYSSLQNGQVFDLSSNSNFYNSQRNKYQHSNYEENIDHPLPLLIRKNKNVVDNNQCKDDFTEVYNFIESAKLFQSSEQLKNPLYLERRQTARLLLNKYGQHRLRNVAMKENFWIEEDEPLDKSIIVGSNDLSLTKSSSNSTVESKEEEIGKAKVSSKLLLCQVCGKLLKGRSSLRTHLALHENAKRYRCPYCTKCFNDKKVQKNHVRTHTREKPFNCSKCSAAFSTSSGLLSHKIKHVNVRPYSCIFCSKTFKTKAVLTSHMKIHEIGPFVCDICDKVYDHKRSLSIHRVSHKIVSKKFSCPHCKKRYMFRSLLTRHMQVSNSSEF